MATFPNTFEIMSGFKKTGIYPINPSEVTDRECAPSKLFQQPQTQDGSASDNPTIRYFLLIRLNSTRSGMRRDMS